MRKKILVFILIVYLAFPARMLAGLPVFDYMAYIQRGLQFAAEIANIIEEIGYLKEQLTNIRNIKDFTDSFMELYEFSLETLSDPTLQQMLHVKKGYLVTSPPTWVLAIDLAGKSYGEYRKTLDAMEDIHSVSDLKALFSQVYWSLEEVKRSLLRIYPEEDSPGRRYADLHLQALARMEVAAISADATASRTKEYTAQFNDEVLEDYKRKISNTEVVNNPTKLLQAIAVGIANLQKMSSLQTAVLAQQVELLSEIMKEWGVQRQIEQERQVEQTIRMYGEKREFKEKTLQTIKGAKDAFLESLTIPVCGGEK